MNTYVRAFASASIAVCILNLFSIDQAQAQTGCYTGIVLEIASLSSTGVKTAWTVPVGRIGKSVSRTFLGENAGTGNKEIAVEVVRNSTVYVVDRFFSNQREPVYESYLLIHLEAGDTIRVNLLDAFAGTDDLTISASNCPDPFSP